MTRVYHLPAAARPPATAAAPVRAPSHPARSPEVGHALAVAGELDRDMKGKGCVQWYVTDDDARTARRAEVEGGVPSEEVQPDLYAPELRGRTDAAADLAIREEAGTWRVCADADASIMSMGVDSLYLAMWTKLDPIIVRRLEALRTIAREQGDSTWIASGPYRWEVQAHGLQGYAVVLTGPTCTLKIARNPSGDTSPQVLVEIRSTWLWRDGPDRCVGQVAALLRGWQGGVGIHKITVSRIDLCVDTTAIQIDGTELPKRRWVTRARGRSQHYHDCAAELGKAGGLEEGWRQRTGGKTSADRRAHSEADLRAAADAAASDHWDGLVYTGVCFGRGSTAVRCYRKDWHVKLPGQRKPWLPALWRARGWDGEQPVWRVECQIRAEALRHMVAVGGKGHAAGIHWEEGSCSAGSEWAAVRRALGAIWRYMVGTPGKSGGWLSLRDPGEGKQRTRWPVSAGWQSIQAAPWDLGTATGTDTVTTARIPPPRQLTKAQLEAAATLPPWNAPRALQPLPPAGPPSLWRLIDGSSLIRELGDGPDLAEQLDVDVSCAEAQAKQLWPQVVGTWRSWAAAHSIATGREVDMDLAALHLMIHGDDPDEWTAGLNQSRFKRALTLTRRVTVKRWEGKAAA